MTAAFDSDSEFSFAWPEGRIVHEHIFNMMLDDERPQAALEVALRNDLGHEYVQVAKLAMIAQLKEEMDAAREYLTDPGTCRTCREDAVDHLKTLANLLFRTVQTYGILLPDIAHYVGMTTSGIGTIQAPAVSSSIPAPN